MNRRACDVGHERGWAPWLAGAALLLAATAASGSPGPHRPTFADRVEAQRALERLYQSWLTGGPRPHLQQAVTQRLLVDRVTRYMRLSAVLEDVWNTPITTEALGHELDRISTSTRSPGRLREVFAVLGNDPVLIQETFVRATLVERLARGFFAYDGRIHSTGRQQAERLNAGLRTGSLHDRDVHARPHIVRVPADGAAADPIGPVIETRDAFITRVRLGDDEVAVYTTPKETWDSWWRTNETRFTVSRVPVVAQVRPLPRPPDRASPASPTTCLPDDTWVPIGGPELRAGHTSAWTGREMIIWGGENEDPLNTGARYDPLIDTWTPISSVNAPQPRHSHASVWTGSRLIVWGGEGHGSPARTFLDSGGVYDPLTDTWTPTSTAGAPIGRWTPTAVWTGDRMIVWGGHAFLRDLNDGALYDPIADAWTPMTMSGAPSPRSQHTAVWTGERMIVWGEQLDSGLYDPAVNSWAPMSVDGSPGARVGHTAVWTGDEMIVWGGRHGINTGSRYDPATDRWAPIAMEGAPSGRGGHLAVWTGDEMIVWGGTDDATGGRYDPDHDSWTATATYGAPAGLSGYRAVWSGTQMIVWGGVSDGEEARAGGRYDPASDTWTPMVNALRQPRWGHDAIWTGREMLVYGGSDSIFDPALGTGERYDPTTDTFTPIATTGAPSPRRNYASVWTGQEMIVWGGGDAVSNATVNTGARYDPMSDTWRPVTTSNAPYGYVGSAIWSGTEMIVCCGLRAESTGGAVYTGARYDPARDEWRMLPNAGPGSLRSNHAAVWTGEEMIIWGGLTTAFTNTGFIYTPASDAWRPMSTVRAPEARSAATAVWTGREMIVWGGFRGPSPFQFDDGGRYDPQTDTWRSMSAANTPSARAGHSAIWTGSEMIVWGGYEGPAGSPKDTGGRYDPELDAWMPTSMTAAPLRRLFHTAVWTGDSMVVFGGRSNSGVSAQSGGAAYGVGDAADLDVDGFTGCGGDCDDYDPLVHPGSFEIPGDTQDEDCDGLTRCNPSASDSRQQHVRCVIQACHDLVRRGLVSKEQCQELILSAGSGPWCGNNATEEPETCDGRDLKGESCRTQGFDVGTLACSPQCDGLDLTDCAAICGDDVRRGFEACDGADLAGRTCTNLGYDDGDLSCNPSCTGFDTSDCTLCGDGEVEGTEACDFDWYDGDIVPEGMTCQDLGFDGGWLYCEATCDAFDVTHCTACGNGAQESGEQCDGADLGGQSCTSIGLDGGTLACRATCSFDVTGCIECGNGVREPGELCDRSDVDDATCEDLGLDSGTLSCAQDCASFDLSGCSSRCGDGIASGGEACDGLALDGVTCGSLGFTGGTLACDASCAAFDTGGCSLCGNARREEGESCEGSDHAGNTCASFGFSGGTLVCRPDCTFSLSTCSVCGNNSREAGETCDGADVGGQTCQSLGHTAGALLCNGSCTAFDVSNCSTCGNGIREGSERCDRFDLGGETCERQGFGGGALLCTAQCTFNYSGCFAP